MEEIEVFDKLSAIASPQFAMTFGDDSEQAIRIAEHKSWLSSIRHERPATNTPFKVAFISAILTKPSMKTTSPITRSSLRTQSPFAPSGRSSTFTSMRERVRRTWKLHRSGAVF